WGLHHQRPEIRLQSAPFSPSQLRPYARNTTDAPVRCGLRPIALMFAPQGARSGRGSAPAPRQRRHLALDRGIPILVVITRHLGARLPMGCKRAEALM